MPDGIILAVNSAFRRLKKLYGEIVPAFERYEGSIRCRRCQLIERPTRDLSRKLQPRQPRSMECMAS